MPLRPVRTSAWPARAAGWTHADPAPAGGSGDRCRGWRPRAEAPASWWIENVTGLLTSGEGRDFADVCGALAEAGYRIGGLEIDAALWLPQSRPRLFIVAMRGMKSATWTGRRAPFHTARLIAAHDRLPPSVRARWAWWAMSEPPARSLDLSDILEPDDRARWFGEAETASLLDLLAPLHRERLETARAIGARQVAAGYRRVRQEAGIRTQRLELRFDGLAGCLRTPSGGSSRQYVVVCRNGTVSARR